jgi:predicted oxidoreductase
MAFLFGWVLGLYLGAFGLYALLVRDLKDDAEFWYQSSECFADRDAWTEQWREAVVLFMAEDNFDWHLIHEQVLAEMCGVERGTEPFTWRWADAARALATPSEGL